MNDRFDTTDFACKIAGLVPGKDAPNGFDPTQFIDPKDIKKMDLFIQYGLGAAHEALAQSGWVADTPEKQAVTGTIIGSGVGGSPVMAEAVETIIDQGAAAAVAVHRAELPRQSGGRLDLDPLRLQGPDRRAGDGVRRVGPGDRRRHAADPHRRGRSDGVRRRRGLGRSDLDRRLCGLAGARHQLQRPADRSLAAVRQGPLRLRAGAKARRWW